MSDTFEVSDTCPHSELTASAQPIAERLRDGVRMHTAQDNRLRSRRSGHRQIRLVTGLVAAGAAASTALVTGGLAQGGKHTADAATTVSSSTKTITAAKKATTTVKKTASTRTLQSASSAPTVSTSTAVATSGGS